MKRTIGNVEYNIPEVTLEDEMTYSRVKFAHAMEDVFYHLETLHESGSIEPPTQEQLEEITERFIENESESEDWCDQLDYAIDDVVDYL